MQHPLTNKTATALATMLVLLAVPYATPKLRGLRVTKAPWDHSVEEEAPAPAPPPTASATVGDQKLQATENAASVTNALPETKEDTVGEESLAKQLGTVAIEDASGHALDAFYSSLARSLKKEPGAVTRILHYGDSVIAGDLIAGTMRRRMQERFGDAGHGFILIANPWEWYFQNDIAHTASDAWSANKITGPWVDDHMFGLGGVSFHTRDAASAWFSTAGHGDFGRNVSRFDLYYLEQPRGGSVSLKATGVTEETLSTKGDEKVARVKSISIPDGAGSLTIRTQGDGDVRLFGVALERDRPGVVYDALGVHSARAKTFEAEDEKDWTAQMALRKPSLLIVQLGTNESENTSITADTYAPVFGALLDEMKRVAPGVPILVASPLDRAIKGENGELKTTPVIERIIEGQRRAAASHGAAFWSTFDAMGGRGTMAKWRHTRPQLGNNDLSHPTPFGAEILGGLFAKAVFAGYSTYASAHEDAPPLPPDPRK